MYNQQLTRFKLVDDIKQAESDFEESKRRLADAIEKLREFDNLVHKAISFQEMVQPQ